MAKNYDYLATSSRQLNFPSDIGSSGIAYVILPQDIDRGDFIQSCYKTGTISIATERGEIFHRVRCDHECLNRIYFPSDYNAFGSPVVWLNADVRHQLPVVVGVLIARDTTSPLEEENSFAIGRFTDDGQVSIQGFGKGILNIEVISKAKETNGTFSVVVRDESKQALFDLFVGGALRTESINHQIKVNDTFELTVFEDTEEAKSKKTTIKYQRGEGLFIQDEFDNVITTNKDKVNILPAKLFEVGVQDTESMVLGETLASLLKETYDAIIAIRVTTMLGAMPITNIPEFQELKAKVDTILSKLSKTK